MRIAGIGASAGGIEAFRQFFEAMPAQSGTGFVVVLHMAADRRSLLPEIIARWTPMPVLEAGDGQQVRPDHIHVIPAGQVATLASGRLRLRPRAAREPAPIDIFFDSLAAEQGAEAVGIVLSGTGHDGALGLKAIKAHGGLTMAQGEDHTAPQHHGMPDSAIATGAVDVVLPVQDMPARLMGLVAAGAEGASTGINEAQRLRICEILAQRLGHDFAGYKDKTFLRRVQRRMHALGIPDGAGYITRLESDWQEAGALFRDLLIGVTTFFRDAAVFDALKQKALPRLLTAKRPGEQLRVWAPGCATGEEAYSLAILLREATAGMTDPPAMQVFATDIDENAIATARAGRYPASLLKDVSPERLARFFHRHDSTYSVVREVRDLCTFSTHSLVRDPPFSRMDLVSCRNLLIYLDPALQASVIPSFHFSLMPGGVLMLGASETVARHEGLFAPLDAQQRLYLRRDVPSPALALPPRFPQGPANPASPVTRPNPRLDTQAGWPRALAQANARVLERFAAPFVVVNEDGLVAHYSSHVGQFLQPALGAPSHSLFDMARPGLRYGLRTVLREVVDSGRPAERVVTLDDAAGPRSVRILGEALPGEDRRRPYLLVLAEVHGGRHMPAQPGAEDSGLASELERELRETRQRIQLLTEEHESALEELRSANEELQSVNEELQSTNEEMATSKEEIQSVSEEVQTVNAQLSMKVDELDRANSDLRNLFESTQVATVFLDRHLVIRSFTPEMAHIYNLIPSDRGRPLPDVVHTLDYGTLAEDVAGVLERLQPVERRVSRRDGTAHYLMRILPYRTPSSMVDGTLVTFVDVTGIVRAEQQQRILVDELNHRVKNMLGVVASLAKQTAARARTLAEFSEAFGGRMQALTAAYALVSGGSWRQVSLHDLVALKLAAFATKEREQVFIEGPAVSLDPNGALAMGLALHELATNAAKYGALSVPEGKVSVGWEVEGAPEAGMLNLHWAEQGGPPVTPPAGQGFGTLLIERSLTHSLGGQAILDYRPEGFRATLKARLASPGTLESGEGE